jgi:hypothetical protein
LPDQHAHARWPGIFHFHKEFSAMTQHDLNREVARATGESIRTINSMGFVPLTAKPIEIERRPLMVDWDQLHNRCESYFPQRARRPNSAA